MMNRWLKLRNFCLILLLLIGFSAFAETKIPLAEKGVVDLSETDWQSGGIFELKGEWNFFWQSYISPYDLFYNKNTVSPDYFPAPGFWNSYQEAPDNNGLGYATYHLKIILPPKTAGNRLLSLKFKEITSSYLIWIDKQFIASNGIPGQNKPTTVPVLKPQTLSFMPTRDTLDVVVMAANFHYRVGGFTDAIIFGDAVKIREKELYTLSIETFLAGALFMIGLYHFTVFFFRRKERSSLWFALICITISLRTVLVGENVFCRFFTQISWEIQNKLEYLTFYLAVLFVIKFIYSLYPDSMNLKLNRAYIFVCLFFCGLTVVGTARIYSMLNIIFQIGVLSVIIYLLFVMLKSLRNNEHGAMLVLIGVWVLGLTTINDILHLRGIIQTFPMVTLGTFSFLFSQAILLSSRYSKSFIAVEDLSARLMNSYQDLKSSQDMIAKQEKLASLGTMTAGIAHEINNPAQAIKFSMSALELNLNDLEQLLTKLINADSLPPEAKDKFYQNLPQLLNSLDVPQILKEISNTVGENLSALKRIEQIVQSTQKYAHKDKSIINCKLNSIIEETLLLVCNQIKHDLVIKTDLAANLPTFPGSEQEISQVIINLLTNARDAIKENGLAPSEGFVEIVTAQDPENKHLILKIRDNGCGISQKHINKIYDPFFTTKAVGKGTGLGLNIVYKLVTHHEGKIDVESHKKIGTVFTITLPYDRKMPDKLNFSISDSGELLL